MLQKFIWTSSGQLSNILQEASALQHQHHLQQQQQQQQQCCSRTNDSVSSSEAEGAAGHPALALSAVALSAAARAARGAGGAEVTKEGGGRTLLERSAADAPECEFTIQVILFLQ